MMIVMMLLLMIDDSYKDNDLSAVAIEETNHCNDLQSH